MRDVAQRRCLLEALDLLFGRFAADHAHEQIGVVQRVLLLLPDNHAEHDVGGRLRNGAAVADERAVGDDAVLDLEFQADLIAAARVHPVEHDVRIRQIMLEIRMHIVFGQDLVVKTSTFHSPSAP